MYKSIGLTVVFFARLALSAPAQLIARQSNASDACDSQVNINTREPTTAIYPEKASGDAPYSLSESDLREVIHIPANFTYGKKPPVILVPGTGSTGCSAYNNSYIKQWADVDYADPVWLNIPDDLLDDIQVNSEYVAYAINYISGVSGTNVSLLAWSQGNIDSQWALKYWPSTRSTVSDLISLSADFHGSTEEPILCPDLLEVGCVPSVVQQLYNSTLIATLRNKGGDSAYVPTTSVFSSTDEIVEPQSGTNASAYMRDARSVGVTNNEVGVVCPSPTGTGAGGFVTHEGMLYNALAFALAVDALQNPGPGQISRLNLTAICPETMSEGLTDADVAAVEATTAGAIAAIAAYSPKNATEPPIMAYAQ